jgi:hypothetical protein
MVFIDCFNFLPVSTVFLKWLLSFYAGIYFSIRGDHSFLCTSGNFLRVISVHRILILTGNPASADSGYRYPPGFSHKNFKNF